MDQTNTPAGSDAPGAADEDHADAAAIDPKEQMRQALDAKKAKEQAGQAHLDGHAKAGGEHAKAGGTRQFRRKSGG